MQGWEYEYSSRCLAKELSIQVPVLGAFGFERQTPHQPPQPVVYQSVWIFF
jgi:hypothetical protein